MKILAMFKSCIRDRFVSQLFLLFLFFLVFGQAAVAFHQQWSPIEIDDNISYLLDDKSIYKDGYNIIATVGLFPHRPIASNAALVVSASYLVKINCIAKSLIVKQGSAFADSETEGAVLDFDAIKLYSALVAKDVDAKLIDRLCMGE
ncbi:MAG: hypothetical protein EBS82_00265 [Methylocystaceae bacterium]|nr:hypothetical protein [Methylocystaceae bacterium]NBT96260.1 hypothetical protein [Methylocystaceae bacterium]